MVGDTADIVEAVEPVVEVVEAPVVEQDLSWYFRDSAPGVEHMVVIGLYINDQRRYVVAADWGTDRAAIAHGTDPDGYTTAWAARQAGRDANGHWPDANLITL